METVNRSCPVWRTEARVEDEPNLVYHVYSNRTAGEYRITLEVARQTREIDNAVRAKLTTWIIDQRLQGNPVPVITADVLNYAKNKQPLPVYERAKRLLRFIVNQIDAVGEVTSITEHTLAAYGWFESINYDEVLYFLHYLRDDMGWIEGEGFNNGYFPGYRYDRRLQADRRISN